MATKGKALNLQQQADRIANANGIPPALFRKLIKQESGWKVDAKSPSGAIGLGQLMPGTAQGLGVDPHDPIQNLQGSAKYLAHQYATFGSWDLALAAYNAGPGAVKKYGGIPPYTETQNYVKSIMGKQTGGGLPLPPPQQNGRPQPSLGDMMGDQPQQQSQLGQILQQSQPTDSAVTALSSLGGMAGKAAQGAQAPIPTPADHLSQDQPNDPMSIDGAVDTTPAAEPSGEKAVGGLNAEFARRFGALQQAVKAAGGSVSIYSGGRDAHTQAKLYQAALKKYGTESEARKHVAPPGKSNHDLRAGLKYGLGDGAVASDLRGDLAIAHRLAARFGLVFPMSYEPWHAELAGIRGK